MSVATPFSMLETLPRPVQRRVRTLGHGLSRLRAGLKLLQQQSAHGTLAGAVSPEWLQLWTGNRLGHHLSLPVDSDSGLGVVITWEERAWRVISPLTAPSGPPVMPAEWWTALMLLQLPALKSFWQRALRAQRFALLQKVLPHVWPLDLTPLPVGATISGLGLASWQDLPRLAAKGRSFFAGNLETGELHSLGAEPWPESLERAASGRWVVIEETAIGAEGSVWAKWATKDGWIDLDGVEAWGG